MFSKALQNLNNIQVSPGQYQDIKSGDIHILQYHVVQREVLNGTMKLL